MITVRPYQKKDFRFVQDICLQTSWLAEKPTQANRAIVCSMYCDYYLDCEAELCFVAVDEQDTPVGYILCAIDWDNYYQQMSDNYLPVVRKLDSSDYFQFTAEIKVGKRYVKQGYAAQLHIDILEEYQRQGVGTQLIAALEEKLKQKFVEGLFLVCGERNQAARCFYEKNGYQDIDYFGNCVVYGKKLFTEEE